MAYATSNPPVLVFQDIAHSGPAFWLYKHATDSIATMDTTGYITDGGARGMKVGDIVIAYDVTNTVVKTLQVISVSATAPGAVDLGDGTTIGTATNTD